MYNYNPLLIKNNSLVLLDCTEVKKKAMLAQCDSLSQSERIKLEVD